ncbi:uncharacterized protein LOC131648150 [Vicia villosa]|uniref:uncharacterized protein LOC131648150 n=1 Tax=Vicia villosa TaxID=3911 RepID=UPI00273CD2EC|nr:uncharacterized protein LOC131648150 [Vicia villosa]
MASLANQLSFFFLFFSLLLLSPQIQARQNKFFSFFSHFKTTNNVNDPQLPQSPSPAPAPAQEPAAAPAPAPAQEPAAAPEIGTTTIPSGPAPEPEFLVETGNGYGLYGIDSTQYSSTKQTPKTITDFENELLNEDFNDDKSYKTGYPQTNLHNNNEVYTKSYNSEEFKNNHNSEEFKNNHNNEEFKNNHNSEEYKNNYNSEEYKNNYNSEDYKNNYNNNNNNNNNYGNGYERKGEFGMSDTRFMENGKYHYNVNSENVNYNNLNGYESGKGNTENEGYYEKNQHPNEFETMEEYEKQQEAQGYTYTP